MRPCRFHPEAENEAGHAIDLRLERSAQIAFELALELERSYKRICESPAQFPFYVSGTRRCVLQDFPYSVIFREQHDAIEIVAVAHVKRRPGYWLNRL